MRLNRIVKRGPWAFAVLACAEPAPPAASPESQAVPDTAASDTYVEGSERVWEAARQRGVVFRAVGQEPGWLLEIHRSGDLTLLTDYGADAVQAAIPANEVARANGATTYTVSSDRGELRIDIRTDPCSDTMSGERFSRTVAVALAETEYHGCGRPLAPM